MEYKNISMFGLGYIGLPTAAILASNHVNVIGVDISENAVKTINEGRIHIVEPGLEEMVHKAVKAGSLRATLVAEEADAFMVAVPTPFTADMQPDLSFIQSVSRSIASVLRKGNLIVLESTSPVGATEQMAEWLAEMRPDLSFPHQAGESSDIRIAYCPERVLPGKVLEELITNDRVIGGMTPKCSQQAKKLYSVFVKGDCLVTNSRTAEMAKLTENAFRDVNIAFANELSLICADLDINVWDLIDLSNRHPRVNILTPGPGVGGHCIAVDPWFIVAKSPEMARLIKTARIVNDGKPEWVLDQVHQKIEAVSKQLGRTPVIGCYGIAFKPNIDDLRESPALNITKELFEVVGDHVAVIEPNIQSLPKTLEGCSLINYDEAVERCDIHLLLVSHDEFKNFKSTSIALDRVVDCVGLLSV